MSGAVDRTWAIEQRESDANHQRHFAIMQGRKEVARLYFTRSPVNDEVCTRDKAEAIRDAHNVSLKESEAGSVSVAPESDAASRASLENSAPSEHTAHGGREAESRDETPVASKAGDARTQMERIVAAAILQDGVIYTGTRHAFIIRDIVIMTGTKPVTGQQGFMTSKGDFVSREIAGEIALRSAQVRSLKYSRTQLFSEDVWDIPSGLEFTEKELAGLFPETSSPAPPAQKPWTVKPVPGHADMYVICDDLGAIPGSGFQHECAAKAIVRYHNIAVGTPASPAPTIEAIEERMMFPNKFVSPQQGGETDWRWMARAIQSMFASPAPDLSRPETNS